jgi:hypothetical protein
MRTFCFLFARALTGNIFAQDQPKTYGKFYGPLATGDWKAKPPETPPAIDPDRRTFFTLPVETKSSTCSVPLAEMEIPKDVHFTAQVVPMDIHRMAPMPQAKLYAPPCDVAAGVQH